MTSNNFTETLPAEITISAVHADRYTTLLQSGIILPAVSGVSLGVFIDSLPGFDQNYISNTIQTIFLDGNAIDDLEHPLTKHDHTIALSAAMPGLAGAIFRRNSLCAALRTQSQETQKDQLGDQNLFIQVKLFNSIALEKGGALLKLGGIFSGETILSFLQQRPSLLESILSATITGDELSAADFLKRLQPASQYFLKVHQSEQQESR